MKLRVNDKVLHNTIYVTPGSWGSETFFFTEDAYDDFMNDMREARGSEPDEPDYLDVFDVEKSIYYRTDIADGKHKQIYFKVVDWSNPSDLIVLWGYDPDDITEKTK